MLASEQNIGKVLEGFCMCEVMIPIDVSSQKMEFHRISPCLLALTSFPIPLLQRALSFVCVWGGGNWNALFSENTELSIILSMLAVMNLSTIYLSLEKEVVFITAKSTLAFVHENEYKYLKDILILYRFS